MVSSIMHFLKLTDEENKTAIDEEVMEQKAAFEEIMSKNFFKLIKAAKHK